MIFSITRVSEVSASSGHKEISIGGKTMKKMAKILLIALGFGLVASVLGFLTSTPAPAQNAVPVRVLNTPLPVQGTVNANVTNASIPVTGTVSANINGTPNVNATITNTVPVSGTVAVSSLPAVTLSGTPTFNFSNTSATPVFADTDGPARSGVAATCDAPFTGGQVTCTLTTVPSNKILVIETISCAAQGPIGGDPPNMALNVASIPVAGGLATGFYYHLAMQHISTTPGFTDNYGLTSPVTIYAAPGTSVFLTGTGQSGATFNDMVCSISGHLVNP
jgi:hypothetical protein